MFQDDPKQVKKQKRFAIKQGIRDNQTLAPKEARLRSRLVYKQSKASYKLAKKDYRLYKGPKPTARALFFKQQQDRKKVDRTVAKKIYKKAKKNDPTYLPNQAKRGAKVATKQNVKQETEKTLAQEDTLSTWVAGRRKIRQAHYNKAVAKATGKLGLKGSKFVISKSYGVANRTYNLTRGRGFVRTPDALSWQGKLRRTVQAQKQRLANSKVGKATIKTGKGVNLVAKPLRFALKNPLSLKSYAIFWVTIFLAALVLMIFGNSGPIQQDEFDLNRSWLVLSQRDRAKSNDEVDYWSNIDDILFYMNYRYGAEWSPDSNWKEGTGGQVSGTLGFNHFSDALDDLWNQLNSDPYHLKTMDDLIKSGSDWVKLDSDDTADYKELIDMSKEIGRYPSYQELANPFYDEDDSHYNEPLVITKRFGYTSPTAVYEKTQLQATTGQTLKATLSGKVTISGDTITISTADARFSYEKVGSIRVTNGAEVKAGDDIGKVTTNGYQTICYQKLEEKATKTTKAKWTAVNPGFYFPFVTYNQTTSVLTKLDGDLATKSRTIKAYLKTKLPNLTDNGLAAMLGNFATESSITAKRSESDYLAPPVGASSTSWDDEAWLNMGYNEGASVGSLVVHRGLGLGMWTDTSDGANRSTLLRNYANQQGKKWYDLELQLDFILNGDNPYYTTIAKNILTSTDDVATLTKRFLNQWEGNAGDKVAERQNNAKQIHTFLTQSLSGGGTLASSWNFPEEYRDKIKSMPTGASMTTQAGSGYAVGQCTWYCYNRLVELGEITDLSGSYGHLGNGQDWVRNLAAKGWKTSSFPSVGAVCSTAGGFDSTYAAYGHVMIVEAVNPDGSFLVSECNYAGNQSQIHWRVCRPAVYYSFAHP